MVTSRVTTASNRRPTGGARRVWRWAAEPRPIHSARGKLERFLRRATVAAALLGAGIAAAGGANNAEPSRIYASVCRACHGERGEGRGDTGAPRLAGQHAWYLERQLLHFRQGRRGAKPGDTFGPQMAAIAATLPDERAVTGIAALAASFAAGAPPDGIEGGDAARGASRYAICAACHGDRGQGQAGIGAPRLAGQHGWYLLRQLEAFRTGLRGDHPDDANGQVMRGIAQTLPDTQAIRDVVAHVLTFH